MPTLAPENSRFVKIPLTAGYPSTFGQLTYREQKFPDGCLYGNQGSPVHIPTGKTYRFHTWLDKDHSYAYTIGSSNNASLELRLLDRHGKQLEPATGQRDASTPLPYQTKYNGWHILELRNSSSVLVSVNEISYLITT